ncbi:MAG: ATP citrate lyase citrate-binding domain-containing protein [Candidatus Hodarchaeales archaeon]|jgi:ATP-citrate lyase beta-subunit
MAQKPIYEYSAKRLLESQLPKYFPDYNYHGKLAVITPDVNWDELIRKNPWIESDSLVVKPDHLFGKRGKANLILLDAPFNELKPFIEEKMNKEIEIDQNRGVLNRFLVEPFIPHENEYYVSITSERESDDIHFSFEGGIFVEENWDQVTHIPVPIGTDIDSFDLIGELPDLGEHAEKLVSFISGLFHVYCDQDFAFLEINPFAITNDSLVVPLDVKARIDDTAAFRHLETWNHPSHPIEFPRGFGQRLVKEEEFVRSIDEQTGASLKLTVLNRTGRVWTMVAGGGASIIYTDTVVDLGFGQELANYGEYSGNPNREHTELYAQTVIDLITETPDPQGKPKILIIGGGIANFTDVKATFAGIVSAIRKSASKLKSTNVQIFVRRGGPNEKEGLKLMKEVGDELGIPIRVYDRYTHMTRVVRMALMENS